MERFLSVNRVVGGQQITVAANSFNENFYGYNCDESSERKYEFYYKSSIMYELLLKKILIDNKNIIELNSNIDIDSSENDKYHHISNFWLLTNDLKKRFIILKLNIELLKEIICNENEKNNFDKKICYTNMNDIFNDIDSNILSIDKFLNLFNEFYINVDTVSSFDMNNIVLEVAVFTDKIFKDQFLYNLDLGNIPLIHGYPSLIKDALLSIFQILIVSFEKMNRSELIVSVVTYKIKNKIRCIIDSNSKISKSVNFVTGIFANFHKYSSVHDIISAGHIIVQDVIVGKHGGGVRMGPSANGGTRVTIELPIRD